ncbi:hypothetical protein [Flavobacterium piscis]|uniref:Uncharacterized protein n=1 Tax=Flavobacterium piscis TaxID=1114874 RepID=A0ABU1YD13_9FLAO|nr:hypothetical protein [Flavobacterium piscis]MDR7212135.1 hypothetical protein [Flavobacterium piscis]
MKKIILLFFGFVCCYMFGQAPTYTMKLSYQSQNLNGCTPNLCSGCQRKDKFWKMGSYVAPYNQNGFAKTLVQGTYSSNLNIAIEVIEDTGSYNFYADGIAVIAAKNQIIGYYYIAGLIPTATNIIKVLDTNYCF